MLYQEAAKGYDHWALLTGATAVLERRLSAWATGKPPGPQEVAGHRVKTRGSGRALRAMLGNVCAILGDYGV